MWTGILLGIVSLFAVDARTSDTLSLDLVDRLAALTAWSVDAPPTKRPPRLPDGTDGWLTFDLTAVEAPASGLSDLLEAEFQDALSRGWALKIELGPARHLGRRYLRVRQYGRDGKQVSQLHGLAVPVEIGPKRTEPTLACYRLRPRHGLSLIPVGNRRLALETRARLCVRLDESGALSATARGMALVPFEAATKTLIGGRLAQTASDTLADLFTPFPTESKGKHLVWRVEMAGAFDGRRGVQRHGRWETGRSVGRTRPSRCP